MDKATSIWDNIVMPIGIEQCCEKIFGSLIFGGLDPNDSIQSNILNDKISIAKGTRARFRSNFPYNIFPNTYAIFYEIFENLNIKIFSEAQLESIIDNNRDLILDSPYINIEQYSATDSGNVASEDDIIMAVMADIKEKFMQLSMLVVDEDSFSSNCVMYVEWYKDTLMTYVSNTMSIMMNGSGIDIKLPGKRRRTYKGREDAKEFYNYNIAIMDSLSTGRGANHVVVDEKWLKEKEEDDSRGETESLFDTNIPEIDSVIGKFKRTRMLGIMGPPKGGKTRFSAYLACRALMAGLNVCIWPLEGSRVEWEAMIIACLITMSSYEMLKKGNGSELTRISSQDIEDKKYLYNKAARSAVVTQRVTLACNPNIGRLSFIEETGYAEDFLDVAKAHWENSNPYDVLVLDSIVNLQSKKGKQKVERLADAYMQTKAFIKNGLRTPVFAICTAQLKPAVVDYLRQHPEETLTETAGAETSETTKTPDDIFGLFSTKEERDSDIMRIYDIAARHSAAFKDFSARCFMDSAFFMSEGDIA